jgi:PadR family transcriptional regulator PadR
MLRGFFRGFIKIHILRHAAHAPVFGLALIRELARHGYDVSPGTVYPILQELEPAFGQSRLTRPLIPFTLR